MIYLSGVKNHNIADELANGVIGLLNTPNSSYSLQGVKVWAADSGCFNRDTYVGDDKYLAWLAAKEPASCLFAAVPDVVGDGAATLAMFPPMAAKIRALGYPVALVGQDGMTPDKVPWDEIDWLFVGGSTAWKLGSAAEGLIRAAQRRGKRVHVGRVNSASRFGWFASLGCDSADGTFLAFGPTANVAQLRRWISTPQQLVIEDTA